MSQNDGKEQPIYIESLQRQRDHRYVATNGDAVHRIPVQREEIWNDYSTIPDDPSPLGLVNDGDSFGNVALRKQKTLQQVAGTTHKFELSALPTTDLSFVIPATFGQSAPLPGGSTAPTITGSPATGYQPVIVDSNGTVVPQEPATWVVDGLNHYIEFPYGVPAHINMAGATAPTITFIQYTGAFGGAASVPPGQNTWHYINAPGPVFTSDDTFPGSVVSSMVLGESGAAGSGIEAQSTEGQGTRIMFDPFNAFFAAGRVSAAQWDAATRATATGSAVFGTDNTVSVTNSAILGGTGLTLSDQADTLLTQRLRQAGGHQIPIQVANADVLLDVDDYAVSGDSTPGDFTVTLPAAPVDGQLYHLKHLIGGNNMFVSGNGNDISDGQGGVVASLSLSLGYARSILWSAAQSRWLQVADFNPATAGGMSPAILDLWVSTAGNDATGDGSMGNPYLTIDRALEDARAIGWNDSASVTIDAAGGNFVFPVGDVSFNAGSRGAQRTPMVIRGSTRTTIAAGATVTAAAQNTSSGLVEMTGSAMGVPGERVRFTSGPLSAISLGGFFATTVQADLAIAANYAGPLTARLPYAGSPPAPGDTYDVERFDTLVDLTGVMKIRADGNQIVFEDMIIQLHGPQSGIIMQNTLVGTHGVNLVADAGTQVILLNIDAGWHAGLVDDNLAEGFERTTKSIYVDTTAAGSQVLNLGLDTAARLWGNTVFRADPAGAANIPIQLAGLLQDSYWENTAALRPRPGTELNISSFHIETSRSPTGAFFLDDGEIFANRGLINAPVTNGIEVVASGRFQTDSGFFSSGVDIVNPGNFGVYARQGGGARMASNGSVTGAGSHGVFVDEGGAFWCDDSACVLSSNGGAGLYVRNGGRAYIAATFTANNNTDEGVRIENGSSAVFTDAVTATGNGQVDFRVQDVSKAFVSGNLTTGGNTADHSIRVSEGSDLDVMGNVTVTNAATSGINVLFGSRALISGTWTSSGGGATAALAQISSDLIIGGAFTSTNDVNGLRAFRESRIVAGIVTITTTAGTAVASNTGAEIHIGGGLTITSPGGRGILSQGASDVHVSGPTVITGAGSDGVYTFEGARLICQGPLSSTGSTGHNILMETHSELYAFGNLTATASVGGQPNVRLDTDVWLTVSGSADISTNATGPCLRTGRRAQIVVTGGLTANNGTFNLGIDEGVYLYVQGSLTATGATGAENLACSGGTVIVSGSATLTGAAGRNLLLSSGSSMSVTGTLDTSGSTGSHGMDVGASKLIVNGTITSSNNALIGINGSACSELCCRSATTANSNTSQGILLLDSELVSLGAVTCTGNGFQGCNVATSVLKAGTIGPAHTFTGNGQQGLLGIEAEIAIGGGILASGNDTLAAGLAGVELRDDTQLNIFQGQNLVPLDVGASGLLLVNKSELTIEVQQAGLASCINAVGRTNGANIQLVTNSTISTTNFQGGAPLIATGATTADNIFLTGGSSLIVFGSWVDASGSASRNIVVEKNSRALIDAPDGAQALDVSGATSVHGLLIRSSIVLINGITPGVLVDASSCTSDCIRVEESGRLYVTGDQGQVNVTTSAATSTGSGIDASNKSVVSLLNVGGLLADKSGGASGNGIRLENMSDLLVTGPISADTCSQGIFLGNQSRLHNENAFAPSISCTGTLAGLPSIDIQGGSIVTTLGDIDTSGNASNLGLLMNGSTLMARNYTCTLAAGGTGGGFLTESKMNLSGALAVDGAAAAAAGVLFNVSVGSIVCISGGAAVINNSSGGNGLAVADSEFTCFGGLNCDGNSTGVGIGCAGGRLLATSPVTANGCSIGVSLADASRATLGDLTTNSPIVGSVGTRVISGSFLYVIGTLIANTNGVNGLFVEDSDAVVRGTTGLSTFDTNGRAGVLLRRGTARFENGFQANSNGTVAVHAGVELEQGSHLAVQNGDQASAIDAGLNSGLGILVQTGSRISSVGRLRSTAGPNTTIGLGLLSGSKVTNHTAGAFNSDITGAVNDTAIGTNPGPGTWVVLAGQLPVDCTDYAAQAAPYASQHCMLAYT